jgi:hypothetical protein
MPIAATTVEDQEQVEPTPLHPAGQEGQILSAKSPGCMAAAAWPHMSLWKISLAPTLLHGSAVRTR